jgi:hypothetical protein
MIAKEGLRPSPRIDGDTNAYANSGADGEGGHITDLQLIIACGDAVKALARMSPLVQERARAVGGTRVSIADLHADPIKKRSHKG